MSTKPTDDRGGRDDLETAICAIGGVVAVLQELPSGGEPVAYLANQLNDHYELADDAFNRIFQIGEYSIKKSAKGEAAASPAEADGDAVLFALIAEYRRIERDLNTPKDGRSDEEIDRLADDRRAVRDKIEKVRPRTLRGVLAVLDLHPLIDDPDWWPTEAIEGLRDFAERERRR